MLQGKIVKLRYYESEDLDLLVSLRGSAESYDFFFEYEPINRQMTKNWWENSFTKPNEKNFIIAQVSDNKAIGTCALTDIDNRNKKAEYGRYYISSEANIPGSATEAELLCLEYAFNHLNLNKVFCNTLENNKKVLSLHKHFGFVEEGHLAKHIYKNGNYVDVKLYALYSDVFKTKYNKIKNKIELLTGSNDES